jgi:hypothetical protein
MNAEVMFCSKDGGLDVDTQMLSCVPHTGDGIWIRDETGEYTFYIVSRVTWHVGGGGSPLVQIDVKEDTE